MELASTMMMVALAGAAIPMDATANAANVSLFIEASLITREHFGSQSRPVNDSACDYQYAI
jgi:hypothetical protein